MTHSRAAALFALAAFGAAPAASAPPPHIVMVQNLAFGPAPKDLRVGDVVEWRNKDIFRHSATATDGSFDVDLPPGAKGRARLSRSGVISYYCRFHPGMRGELNVGR